MENTALLVCGGITAGVLIITLLCSFSSVPTTGMALRYNSLWKTVDPQPVLTPGIKFVGPFTSLIQYPKTIQEVKYDRRHRDILDGRTSDGLPLLLGVNFQYTLLPGQIYKLYNTYENNVGDYQKVVQLNGIHIITEVATKFSAYEFFNSKQNISTRMQNDLDDYFRKELCATVVSLQINEDQLPQEFMDSIVSASGMQQKISTVKNQLEAKLVDYRKDRMVARQQAKVTLNAARGESYGIINGAEGEASRVAAVLEAEAQAYGGIKQDLGLEGPQLLNYIYYDTLAGSSVSGDPEAKTDTSFLIGVNPAAYISQ